MENTCQVCSKKFPVTRRERNKATCGRACAYALRSLKRKETHRSEGGEPKACPDCGAEFLDPTRRLTMVRCLPCTKAMMVRTRHEGGTYVQSPERRQWQSDMLRRKYEEGWNPNTPEHREKLSRGMRERWASGKMAAETRKTSIQKYGFDHHTQRPCYVESVKKFSFAKHGLREDLGIYFRSSWEANFARYLTFIGKKWEYEPGSFRLASGKRYVPDFWVEEESTYYEVKGFYSEGAKKKVEDFIEEYGANLVLVDTALYKKIASEFSKEIPNWEA